MMFKSLSKLSVYLLISVTAIWSISCGDKDNTSGSSTTPVLTNFENAPVTGNVNGQGVVPAKAQAEDISNPDQVIGTGTAASCTGDLVVDAIAKGGKIVFDCGQDPITIVLPQTAKVFNDANDEVIIDGGGLVTLSGGGQRRILYMNTCDQDQNWTTSTCQNQDHPRLTVQNITFADGNSISEIEYTGGGAIWSRGGQLKIVNCRFFNNRCATTGPDVGGGAVRVFDQYEDRPVYVVNSTFGGAQGFGNSGSNGGAISSIGVSWTLINSVMTYNTALGNGGNPAQAGTPGGGSGGAVYNDGNLMTLSIYDCIIEENTVNAFGSGIFFVSNNKTGNVVIDGSTIMHNHGGSWYEKYIGISAHKETDIKVTNSTILEP